MLMVPKCIKDGCSYVFCPEWKRQQWGSECWHTAGIRPVRVPMICGTQRPGACSMHWVLAWNSSTLVRWRTRAGSSVSFSCSVRAWRCTNRACLDDTHSQNLKTQFKCIIFWIYTFIISSISIVITFPFSCPPSSTWSHTPQHTSLCWSGSLQ